MLVFIWVDRRQTACHLSMWIIWGPKKPYKASLVCFYRYCNPSRILISIRNTPDSLYMVFLAVLTVLRLSLPSGIPFFFLGSKNFTWHSNIKSPEVFILALGPTQGSQQSIPNLGQVIIWRFGIMSVIRGQSTLISLRGLWFSPLKGFRVQKNSPISAPRQVPRSPWGLSGNRSRFLRALKLGAPSTSGDL